jgi:(p)ppGpp synthase/HD superfamily hydrolase
VDSLVASTLLDASPATIAIDVQFLKNGSMSIEIPNPVLTDRFAQAFAFAGVVHASQTRKGTTIPYVSHVMGVASLVLEHGGDEDTAIAALVHDAPEDQGGRYWTGARRSKLCGRRRAWPQR